MIVSGENRRILAVKVDTLYKDYIRYLIKWQNEGNKIAVFCSGCYGVRVADLLLQCGIRVNVFLDNNADKWGQEIYEGITCISPNEIAGDETYITFIGIRAELFQEIFDCAKEIGLVHIGEINDVMDDLIANYTEIYLKLIQRYEKLPAIDLLYSLNPNAWAPKAKVNSNIDENERIAVYTGVFGNYDEVCFPKVCPKNIDYYFVSDEKPKELGVYQWIDAKTVIPDYIISPIKRNRFIKMKPHVLFPQYKYSIYVDGNIEIKEDISSFIQENQSGISTFMHPNRECLFYEGIMMVSLKRVVAEDVCRQMKRYLEEGMPIRYGLPEMMVIAREHRKQECIKVMETWWEEFNAGAQRDQLSFMYAMWKNDMSLYDMTSLGNNSRECDKISIIRHYKDSLLVENNR